MFADMSEAQITLWSNYTKGEVVHREPFSLRNDRWECPGTSALLKLLSPGAEACSGRNQGETTAVGTVASPPLPASPILGERSS